MSNQNHLKPAIVESNQIIAEGVHVLSFSKTSETFAPGQVLDVSPSPSINAKPYSICSTPDDPFFSILFNVVENGVLTPHLAKAKAGDTLYCSDVHGSFIHGEEQGFWIAAGTGISPFRSMLLAGQGNQPTLIHGGKYIDSFYFENEFKEKLHENYIRCCSREKDKNLFNGRLTSYLLAQNSLSINYKYYLCGSPQMVVEVRDILISKGIPFEKIAAEIYF